jgi:hypothetical protein
MATLPHQGIRGGFYHLIPGENITFGFSTSARLIAARDLFESQSPRSLFWPRTRCLMRDRPEGRRPSRFEEDALLK